jgi:hypothetical protein
MRMSFGDAQVPSGESQRGRSLRIETFGFDIGGRKYDQKPSFLYIVGREAFSAWPLRYFMRLALEAITR